jgi:hypothetical protein
MHWSVVTEDFESAPATDNAGFFRDGTVDFHGDGVTNGSFGQPSPDNVWEDFSTSGGTSLQTIWTFDNPMRAWGAFWDLSLLGSGTGLDVFLGYFDASDIEHTLRVGTIPNDYAPGENEPWPFWGFIADGPFTEVLVAADGEDGTEGSRETYYMDNMVYAPEPGILTLLGMGLAGAALWMRRRRG